MTLYQALTRAPAGTHNNAQASAGYTQNDMAFMAAMFPAQFAQFAGFPSPSPAVTQLEQAAVDDAQEPTEVAAPGPAEEAAPVKEAAPAEDEAPAEEAAPPAEPPAEDVEIIENPMTMFTELEQASISVFKANHKVSAPSPKHHRIPLHCDEDACKLPVLHKIVQHVVN